MVKPNNNSLKVFPYLISSSSGDTEHTLLTVMCAAGSQSLCCMLRLSMWVRICVSFCVFDINGIRFRVADRAVSINLPNVELCNIFEIFFDAIRRM